MIIDRVEKIWDDGGHNAFTDLCFWKNTYWICFRHANSHITKNSKIFIICSDNGVNWSKVGEINEPDVDLRDAKWAILGDSLAIYTYRFDISLDTGYPMRAVLYSSKDGENFVKHEFEPQLNFRFWNIRSVIDGYLATVHCQYKEDGFKKDNSVDLYFSKDGYVWNKKANITSEDFPNETAFDVEEDGTVHALVRREEGNNNAYYYYSKPPYDDWKFIDTGFKHIGGPAMCRFGNKLLVVGRTVKDSVLKTSVFWLRDGRLEYILDLPSGKDTSYAGIIDSGDGRSAYISYYSGHEYENGAVEQENGEFLDRKQNTAIYFAKLKF